jgi:hypothetical protein
MSYVKYPYDKLGECSLENDTTLSDASYNGLGNRLKTLGAIVALKIFLDTDQKQKDWYEFYENELNHGTKPFMVKIPYYNEPLYRVVQITDPSIETVKDENGWHQTIKVAMFFGDGVVFDKNGDIVTDINGDPITAKELCENKEVKYCGERIGPPGKDLPFYPLSTGPYNLCFDREHPKQNKHLTLTYTPNEAQGMLAWYQFEGNLWNSMRPPTVCQKGQYEGDSSSEVNYAPSRFKTGLHQNNEPMNGLVVKEFPFVYTASAISFWIVDVSGNLGVLFEATAEGDPTVKASIECGTNQLKVTGSYFTTDALANTSTDKLGSATMNNVIISFIADGVDRKCRIFIDGQDVTTQEGVMISTLNDADMFRFALRKAGETANINVDDLRFLNKAVIDITVARRIHNESLRSTEFFKDGSALALWRLDDNGHDCGDRYNGNEVGALYAEDSFFLYEDIYDQHPKCLHNPTGNTTKPRVYFPNLPLNYTNCCISFWSKGAGTNPNGGGGYEWTVGATRTNGTSLFEITPLADWVYTYVDTPGTVNHGRTSSLSTDTRINWMHTAVNVINGAVRIYINGEDKTEIQPNTTNVPVPYDFWIGAVDVTRVGVEASIDHVRVFRRALTDKEIKSLYDERKSLSHW